MRDPIDSRAGPGWNGLAAPHPDNILSSLEAVRAQRTLWGVVHLTAGGGFWASPVYDVRFLLILDGHGYLDAEGTSTPLSRGDFVLLTRGSRYSLKQSHDSKVEYVDASKADRKLGPPFLKLGLGEPRTTVVCATIAVDLPRWRPVAKYFPDVIRVKSADGALPYWAGPLNDLEAFNRASMGPGAESLLCRLAEICMIQSLRAYAVQQWSEVASPKGMTFFETRVNRAVQLINSNPTGDWSVSKLARDVGMSRSSFSESFTRNVGEPPMSYVTNVRMGRAAELLKLGKQSVSEIADQVGYESDSAFARTFKRRYGVTPRTYQKSKG